MGLEPTLGDPGSPVLSNLDERSTFSKLPAPDSNRQMRQSKCRALAFWRADNSYPGRTRTASYETQNLAPSQFGDRASFQPAAEKYYVQFPYTVSDVQFGSELLLPGRPRRHVRLPPVLYTAFLFFVRFPAALTSARSDRANGSPGIRIQTSLIVSTHAGIYWSAIFNVHSI